MSRYCSVIRPGPDALKPSCVFDDDDFYTIDQMKAALRELKGYRFTLPLQT